VPTLFSLDVLLFDGHFTHETESPLPSHSKHPHWWRRWSRSKFASHYAWGTNGVCECKGDGCKVCMDFYMASKWTMFHDHLDYFQQPPLEVRPNTKPGDHGTPNAHGRWFILFYHAWGPACLEIHWNSIWLKARSHMASHYTWGSVTVLHDLGGVLGQPLDTFFWVLTISWSRLLAHGWNGYELSWALANGVCYELEIPYRFVLHLIDSGSLMWILGLNLL
jgi:hypothetical protein